MRLQMRPRNSSDLSGKNLTAGSNVLGLITSRRSGTQICAHVRISQYVDLELQTWSAWQGLVLAAASQCSSVGGAAETYRGCAFRFFFSSSSMSVTTTRTQRRELTTSRTWASKMPHSRTSSTQSSSTKYFPANEPT